MSEKFDLISVKKLITEVVAHELYPKFLSQIQKDLDRAGMDYELENSEPKELFSELHALLVKKMQYNFNDYVNLLYAVDVSEAEVRRLDEENIENIAGYATYLILKREWQKVWYRSNANQ